MKKILILLITMFFFQVYCDYQEDPYRLAITSCEPSTLVNGCVNAISGDYVFDQYDIIATGAEPLKLRRKYISRYCGSPYVGNFCIEDYFIATYSSLGHRFIITEPSGTQLVYHVSKKDGKKILKKKKGKKKYKLILNENVFLVGLTNCSNGEISGRLNLKNNEAEVEIEKGNIIAMYVRAADGSERIYKHSRGFKFRLEHEILPNKNHIFYSYGEKELKEIRSTNPTGTKTYSWIKFNTHKEGEDYYYYINTSDKKEVFYKLCKKGKNPKKIQKNPSEKQIEELKKNRPTTFLKEIKSFDNPDECLGYLIDRQSNELKKYPLVNRSFPDGRYLNIAYNNSISPEDPLFYTVTHLNSPVGKDNLLHTTHSFHYEPAKIREKEGRTQVFDAYGNRTVYNFSKYLRLTSIERYDKNNKFINKEELIWGEENEKEATYLLCKSFYDADNNVIFSKKYIYDDRGNPIQETIYGNLSGENPQSIQMDDKKLPLDTNVESFSKMRKFSDDKRNYLIVEKDDTGLSVHFTYHNDTDLISSKIIKFKDDIKIRTFYEYNEDNILIAEIVDNGTTLQKDNLTNVTQRQIKRISPRNESNFINMPSIIEEKYLDLDTGIEKLIKKTVLTYSEMGQIIKEEIFDSSNVFCYSIQREFDKYGNLLKETNPINQKATYTYDNNFNRTSEIPFSEKIQNSYEYDCSNRLIYEKSASLIKDQDIKKHITSHSYDLKSNKTSTTDYLGNTTQYEYDVLSNVIKVIKPQMLDQNSTLINPQINNLYDSSSRLIEERNERGFAKNTQYNCYNKPTQITYPDRSKESFVYNFDGTLKYHIDQIGTKTCYEYDFLQRDIKITKLSNTGEVLSEEETTYDTFNLISKKDSEGTITKYKYNFSNQLIAEQINNEITKYHYDSLGRIYKTEILNGENTLVTIQKTDFLDRIIEVRKEDISGNILFLETYTYDSAGNKKSIIKFIKDDDGNNLQTKEQYLYDPFNRLVQHIDPLGYETTTKYIENLDLNILQKVHIDPVNLKTIETFDSLENLSQLEKRNSENILLSKEELFYDPTNNLSKQISTILSPTSPPKHIETLWEYDSMNKHITLIEANNSPDKKITRYTYYENGQLYKTIKPDETVLENTYNSLGHQISLVSSDNSINYTFKNNLLGQLLSSFDNSTHQSIERSLDHKGRVLKEKLANDLEIENVYDLAGRKIKQILPDQSQIEYIYNALYLTKIIRKDKNGSFLYEHLFSEYDLSGNLTEENLINNLGTISYKLNPLHNPISIDAYKTENSSTNKTSYFTQTIDLLDPDGKIRKMTYSSKLGSDTSEFFYDDLKQLTQETGLFNKNYLFDSNKNRVQKDNDTYQINDLNQISKTDNSTFIYDKNGNPIKQQTSDSEINYYYDALDRLIEISKKDDYKLEFTYDSQHRRISKTYSKYSNRIIYKPLIHKYTEFYIFDDQNEIGAYQNNNLTHLRILKDSDHAEIGSSIAIEINNKIYAPIHDLQQNITLLISSKDHSPYEFYRYSTFGEEKIYDSWFWEKSTSYVNNPWRFSSKRIDEESNLIYYGRRYYDPEFGRWLTPDPQGFTDGLNLYAFVNNDPLTNIDLYGLYALPGMFTRPTKEHEPRFLDIQGNPGNNSIIHLINGQANKSYDAQKNAEVLYNNIKHINKNIGVRTFHTGTQGFLFDSIGSLLQRMNFYEPKRVTMLRDTMINEAERSKKNNLKSFFIDFSRGGLDSFQALRTLPKEQRKQLIILNCGFAKAIPKDYAFVVKNIASIRDPIPTLMDSGACLGLERNCINVWHTDKYSIQTLPKKNTTPFLNHTFNNADYQASIADNLGYLFPLFGEKHEK